LSLNIEQALAAGVSALNTCSESPKIDTEVLLCYVLDKSRTYLFTWPDKILAAQQERDFTALLNRRKKGEPIAHITQFREFWSLKFKVSPDTLIPRPDTETLVELALSKATKATGTLLDLGTGTGAIALSLASELPNWQITACDFKAQAVALAKENQQRLSIDNADIIQSDWFASLDNHTFDLIVSNPPYIDADDPHLTQGDVRFEPLSALVADNQGLADIEHIIDNSRSFLVNKGWLLIEHGYQQGLAVRTMFNQMGYKNTVTCQDLAGNDRITLAQWSKD
jgi:release factor glutamine methyltransferase